MFLKFALTFIEYQMPGKVKGFPANQQGATFQVWGDPVVPAKAGTATPGAQRPRLWKKRAYGRVIPFAIAPGQ